jgi:hypothetical protein
MSLLRTRTECTVQISAIYPWLDWLCFLLTEAV